MFLPARAPMKGKVSQSVRWGNKCLSNGPVLSTETATAHRGQSCKETGVKFPKATGWTGGRDEETLLTRSVTN